MEKCFLVKVPIENIKKYDIFIWFKDNKWCIGSVLEEGLEGKTRVKVNGLEYETHTNTLYKIKLFNKDKDLLMFLHDLDYLYAIENDLIDKDILVDFTVGDQFLCSDEMSCRCKGDIFISKCENSYLTKIGTITGLIEKDYSQLDAIRFASYLSMCYSEKELMNSNLFWYKKTFDHWKTTKTIL